MPTEEVATSIEDAELDEPLGEDGDDSVHEGDGD
jgi:hypothetical protein